MLELWRAGGSNTGFSPEAARAVEAEGWDGQMFMDSQSLSADPWVLMGAWAQATERIRLSTGVTNPLTRNLAVTATSAATVHAISNGRAVLGIGRGDSALAYLGYAPASTQAFGRVLETLQTLLSGGAVDFAALKAEVSAASSSDSLSLADRPGAARLKWLPEGMSKVPLDVAATGPKVIAMSAPVAERVTFSVGAVRERIDWALGLAREARAAKGLDGGASYGAQVIVVCRTDEAAALQLATTFIQPLARFQVIQGNAAGPLADGDVENLQAIRRAYDMNRHGDISGASKLAEGATIAPEFVRRYAVVGTPDHCTRRLLELAARGLERFVVVGPGFYPESWGEKRHLFTREVLPALKAGSGA